MFLINGITREITSDAPKEDFLFGVTSDEKANIKYFKGPRYTKNSVDLASASIRINYINGGAETDQYIVTDLEADEEYITFSWTFHRNVTKYKGAVQFIVCAVKCDADGSITNEWNTTSAKGTVQQGIEVDGSEYEEETADAIESILLAAQNRINAMVVDDTLSQAGVAADAAATGAAIESLTKELVKIDNTLTESGMAADSKVTGDAIEAIKKQLANGVGLTENEVNALISAYAEEYHLTGVTTDEVIDLLNRTVDDTTVITAVTNWLDAHPEATTTVLDKSIDSVKLSDKLAENLGLIARNMLGNTEQVEGSATFSELFQKVKNEVIDECKGDFNKIPLIIHTDSHTTLKGQREIFKTINELINWDEISFLVNLGDCVLKGYSLDSDGETIPKTNTALEDMLEAVQDIPLSKQLNVFGNHDTWTWIDAKANYGASTSNQSHLQQYFRNPKARRYSNNGWFTVTDDYRNVKYLVLSAYEVPTTGITSNNKGASSAQIDFLIDELGKNDGYDIIILCHETLYPDWDNRVLPNTSDLSSSTQNESNFWATLNTNDIFSARKRKSSGTFTDREGVVHEFDFSGCTTELLCSLHGHMHYDVYAYIDDKMLCNAFSAFTRDERWIYFVVVDRANKELKVWKVSTKELFYLTYTVPFEVTDGAATYRIKRRLLNCTPYAVSNFVRQGQPYAQRIVANTGKTLGDIKVEMAGVDVTDSALSEDGYIFIPSVSGDVTVTAVDDTYDISVPFFNVTANYSAYIGDVLHTYNRSTPTTLTWNVTGEAAEFSDAKSIEAPNYYTYDIKVTMGDDDVTDSVVTYSRGQAIVNISPVTDDVLITVEAQPLSFTPVSIDENGVESQSDSQYSSDYIDVSSYKSIRISPCALGNFAVALYDGDKRFKALVANITYNTDIYISDDTKYVRLANHGSLKLKVYDAHSENKNFDVTITKPAGITVDNDISTVQAGGGVKLQTYNTYADTTMAVTATCGTTKLSGVFDAETRIINVPYVNGDLSIDISATLNLPWNGYGNVNGTTGVVGSSTYEYITDKVYLDGGTVLQAKKYARQNVFCFGEDNTYLGKCTIPNTGIFALLDGTSYVYVTATPENIDAGNSVLSISGQAVS